MIFFFSFLLSFFYRCYRLGPGTRWYLIILILVRWYLVPGTGTVPDTCKNVNGTIKYLNIENPKGKEGNIKKTLYRLLHTSEKTMHTSDIF